MTSTIAIVGSRGIPNRYGGFEQFAEILSVDLVRRGHAVTVYNASFHPYEQDNFNGVSIVKKWCPENLIGSSAHFLYDYLCLRDAIKKNFDIILELGYQSSALSMRLCRRGKSRIVTNMDGLEWRRQKWGRVTKAMTRWFEQEGVRLSDHLVSDNKGIQSYIMERYQKESSMIPYGADIFDKADETALSTWGLSRGEYYLLIARMEPENNIEIILDGFIRSASTTRFIVVGGTDNKYGSMLRTKYAGSAVEFVGGVYDQNSLNNLRYFSRLYFHGHSVGGTNPSLLEAMGAQAAIAAHRNEFNESVLGADGYYFSAPEDVTALIHMQDPASRPEQLFRENNTRKIQTTYSWQSIVDQYDHLFRELLSGD